MIFILPKIIFYYLSLTYCFVLFDPNYIIQRYNSIVFIQNIIITVSRNCQFIKILFTHMLLYYILDIIHLQYLQCCWLSFPCLRYQQWCHFQVLYSLLKILQLQYLQSHWFSFTCFRYQQQGCVQVLIYIF